MDGVLTAWRLTYTELCKLKFVDFWEMANALMRERKRDSDAAIKRTAYGAWLMGAGNNKTWRQFCEHYGLVERPPKQTEEDRRKEIERAYTIAAQAENLLKKRS